MFAPVNVCTPLVALLDTLGLFAGGGEILRVSASNVDDRYPPPVFSVQVDVFPSQRRDVRKEFDRDLKVGFVPGQDGLAPVSACSSRWGRANIRVTSRQIRHARAIRAFMSRSKRP